MPVSEDTDRTQAIVITHLSHRWLKWLDARAGKMKEEQGGLFMELRAIWRGHSKPKSSDIIQRFECGSIE